MNLRAIQGVTLALLLGSGVAGAVTVEFVDGRVLEVLTAQRQADVALLSMEGGGQIAVPAGRIANWEDLGRRAAAKPLVQPVGEEPWRSVAGEFSDVIAQAAKRHRLDPVLLTAMTEVESRFDPTAVSHKGAGGLLQLMPATAERFGVQDRFDAAQNVNAGARYFSWLLDRYEGRTDLALAGYNAGEDAVDHHQGVPPYRETQDYVVRVLESFDRMTAASGGNRGFQASLKP